MDRHAAPRYCRYVIFLLAWSERALAEPPVHLSDETIMAAGRAIGVVLLSVVAYFVLVALVAYWTVGFTMFVNLWLTSRWRSGTTGRLSLLRWLPGFALGLVLAGALVVALLPTSPG